MDGQEQRRAKRKTFSFQLKLMDLSDGLELVQRLSGERPTKYGTARVWRNSIKAAELVAQYLVTAGMVRPVPETGANILEQILSSWALLHSKLKDVAPTLPGMIRKLIEPAESAQHIYIFCAVLAKHVSNSSNPRSFKLTKLRNECSKLFSFCLTPVSFRNCSSGTA